MPVKLRREEVVTIQVLSEKGQKNTSIAKTLGVTEGNVRYHRRRYAEGATDGRKDKPQKAEEVEKQIKTWFSAHEDEKRPVNVKDLYEHLQAEWGYGGSYKSVLRFVRKHYPLPRMRTYRRVETPPGAQTQTDWGEYPRVDIGEGTQPLHLFLMSLSHSRQPAAIWSRREDQLSWLSCHNAAYRRLQGVAAVNRVDNVKTAIAVGAGAWGTINETYRTYARAVGFHVDACQPRAANAKGKVEAKVRLSRLRVNPEGKCFDGLKHLQSWTDDRLEQWSRKAICPATGKTVSKSWEGELSRLAPLPILPEPYDVVVLIPEQI